MPQRKDTGCLAVESNPPPSLCQMINVPPHVIKQFDNVNISDMTFSNIQYQAWSIFETSLFRIIWYLIGLVFCLHCYLAGFVFRQGTEVHHLSHFLCLFLSVYNVLSLSLTFSVSFLPLIHPPSEILTLFQIFLFQQ